MDAEQARRLLGACGIDPKVLEDNDAVTRAQRICDAVATHRGEQRRAELFDEHVRDEFVLKSADITMTTMVENPYVLHLPTMAGGDNGRDLHEFYARWFIPQWPPDTSITPISRTIGDDRMVDEFIVSFTHDRELPVYAPGIAPTGRAVELPHIVVMGFEGDKVAYEHIYWDQGSLLAQLGVLDGRALPLVGAEAAQKLRDRHAVPANPFLSRSLQRPA